MRAARWPRLPRGHAPKEQARDGHLVARSMCSGRDSRVSDSERRGEQKEVVHGSEPGRPDAKRAPSWPSTMARTRQAAQRRRPHVQGSCYMPSNIPAAVVSQAATVAGQTGRPEGTAVQKSSRASRSCFRSADFGSAPGAGATSHRASQDQRSADNENRKPGQTNQVTSAPSNRR